MTSPIRLRKLRNQPVTAARFIRAVRYYFAESITVPRHVTSQQVHAILNDILVPLPGICEETFHPERDPEYSHSARFLYKALRSMAGLRVCRLYPWILSSVYTFVYFVISRREQDTICKEAYDYILKGETLTTEIIQHIVNSVIFNYGDVNVTDSNNQETLTKSEIENFRRTLQKSCCKKELQVLVLLPKELGLVYSSNEYGNLEDEMRNYFKLFEIANSNSSNSIEENSQSTSLKPAQHNGIKLANCSSQDGNKMEVEKIYPMNLQHQSYNNLPATTYLSIDPITNSTLNKNSVEINLRKMNARMRTRAKNIRKKKDEIKYKSRLRKKDETALRSLYQVDQESEDNTKAVIKNQDVPLDEEFSCRRLMPFAGKTVRKPKFGGPERPIEIDSSVDTISTSENVNKNLPSLPSEVELVELNENFNREPESASQDAKEKAKILSKDTDTKRVSSKDINKKSISSSSVNKNLNSTNNDKKLQSASPAKVLPDANEDTSIKDSNNSVQSSLNNEISDIVKNVSHVKVSYSSSTSTKEEVSMNLKSATVKSNNNVPDVNSDNKASRCQRTQPFEGNCSRTKPSVRSEKAKFSNTSETSSNSINDVIQLETETNPIISNEIDGVSQESSNKIQSEDINKKFQSLTSEVNLIVLPSNKNSNREVKSVSEDTKEKADISSNNVDTELVSSKYANKKSSYLIKANKSLNTCNDNKKAADEESVSSSEVLPDVNADFSIKNTNDIVKSDSNGNVLNSLPSSTKKEVSINSTKSSNIKINSNEPKNLSDVNDASRCQDIQPSVGNCSTAKPGSSSSAKKPGHLKKSCIQPHHNVYINKSKINAHLKKDNTTAIKTTDVVTSKSIIASTAMCKEKQVNSIVEQSSANIATNQNILQTDQLMVQPQDQSNVKRIHFNSRSNSTSMVSIIPVVTISSNFTAEDNDSGSSKNADLKNIEVRKNSTSGSAQANEIMSDTARSFTPEILEIPNEEQNAPEQNKERSMKEPQKRLISQIKQKRAIPNTQASLSEGSSSKIAIITVEDVDFETCMLNSKVMNQQSQDQSNVKRIHVNSRSNSPSTVNIIPVTTASRNFTGEDKNLASSSRKVYSAKMNPDFEKMEVKESSTNGSIPENQMRSDPANAPSFSPEILEISNQEQNLPEQNTEMNEVSSEDPSQIQGSPLQYQQQPCSFISYNHVKNNSGSSNINNVTLKFQTNTLRPTLNKNMSTDIYRPSNPDNRIYPKKTRTKPRILRNVRISPQQQSELQPNTKKGYSSHSNDVAYSRLANVTSTLSNCLQTQQQQQLVSQDILQQNHHLQQQTHWHQPQQRCAVNRVFLTSVNPSKFEYICDFCPNEIIFESAELLHHHVNVAHNYSCELCQNRYPSHQELLLHMDVHAQTTLHLQSNFHNGFFFK